MNKKVYVVMYHYTRDLIHSRYPNIKGLDIKLFKEQIKYLKENFNIIRMEDLIAAIKKEKELPEKALLLTFDDGYIDNYTVAFPILEEEGLQGSFFIPGKIVKEHKLLDVNKTHYILASTSNINELLNDIFERMDYYRGKEFEYPSNKELFEGYSEESRFDSKEVIFIKRVLQTLLPEKIRNQISSDLFEKYVGVTEEQLAYELYMTEDQIRIMRKRGMFIGVHGYDHYWLGNLSEFEMQNDILKALESLKEFIDKDNWVINFPYGSYNKKVIDYIKTKGAILAFTTKVNIMDLSLNSQYELPRLDCNDFPPKSFNYTKIK